VQVPLDLKLIIDPLAVRIGSYTQLPTLILSADVYPSPGLSITRLVLIPTTALDNLRSPISKHAGEVIPTPTEVVPTPTDVKRGAVSLVKLV